MTRKLIALVFAATFSSVMIPGFGAPQATETLESTFARMDKAAATFKGLTADIRQLSHTEVVDKDDIEEGTIAVKRIKSTDTRILIKFARPDQKMYSIGDGKFRSFNPKSQEAQEADLGKSKDLVKQFMLLAFGSNSDEVKAAYTVKLGGADTVNGEKATRLEMVPKSADILKHVKRCDMWVSDKGMTLQQKFYQTGGDYVLATYSHMTLVPNLADSAVKLEFPRGVKVSKIK